MANLPLDKKVRFLINLLFFTAIVLIAVFCVKYLFFWILPFIIGFSIAFFLRPAVEFLADKTVLPRKAAAVLVITTAYGVVLVLLWLLFTNLFSELGALFYQLPDIYTQYAEPVVYWFNDLVFQLYHRLSPEAAAQLSAFLDASAQQAKNFVMGLSEGAISLITRIFKFIPLLLITLMFSILSSYLISVDYRRVVNFLLRQLPSRIQPWIIECKNFLKGSLFKLVKAYAIIMAITFAELAAGLSLLQVRYAVVLAALIAALDILPLIGTGGIMIPWAALAALDGDYFLAIGLLILYAIICFVRTILEPKIIGSQIGLHPLVTLTGMFFGYKLFGVTGLFLMPIVILLLQYLNETGKVQLWKP